MLPTDSTRLRARPSAICYVVAASCSLSDREHSRICDALQRGSLVHILHVEPGALKYVPRNVALHRLEEIDSSRERRVKNLHEQAHADRSDRIRDALEKLHNIYHFSEIEFTALGGLAFRSIQAKCAGLAFGDVKLSVRLDSCSRQVREREERWPTDLDDLMLDYMEKFAVEQCDHRIALNSEAVDFVRRTGWQLRNVDRSIDCQSESEGSDLPLVTVAIPHFNLGRHLREAIASLARQTYTNMEVLIVDDGSTDAESIRCIDDLALAHPRCRIIRQANGGIGAARNRGLIEARGEYFIPMDADNFARPQMVELFVRAMNRNPQLSAMTCYYLAFQDDPCRDAEKFCYACRPTGGPHAAASIRNVYGDANGIFRTDDFRAIGGYEVDRNTSCEDWEAYVKLVHAGKHIGVIPEYLFYYRHRTSSFSRTTNWFENHQRVLRQFAAKNTLSANDAAVLWTALLGFQRHVEWLIERQRSRRYRVADAIHSVASRVPQALRWATRQIFMPRS